MSEKIIVKLRRDNISVSSCKEGVYLTFDAENARPIICKYSEVITIFTPNQIYDVEDIMLMLGPVLHSFLEKAKISTGLLHWESANPFVKLRSRAVKDYVLILNEIRKIAIEDDLKAIVISLDDRAFPDFLFFHCITEFSPCPFYNILSLMPERSFVLPLFILSNWMA